MMDYMDYEMFKEVVKEKFLSYMPEGYQDMEVRIREMEKVNRKEDGIVLCRADGGETVSPTISVRGMYKNYFHTRDLQAVLQDAANVMAGAFRQAGQIPKVDRETAKDSIIFQLVNTAQNKEMLGNMPHREYQDLSIVYRWVTGIDENSVASAMVTNGMAEALGMREGQLFLAAAENTRRMLPPVVKSMNEVVRDILVDGGMPPEMADTMIGEMPPEKTMWVITNERRMGGAASMLYEDGLHGLAESVGSDLYILPSSVHEVIAVPVGMGDPEKLAEMVAEVNMGQVELGDRLSNQVYHYDRNLREVTLATDTRNKWLDKLVDKPVPAYEPPKIKRSH